MSHPSRPSLLACVAGLVVLALLAGVRPLRADEPQLRVGFGVADITPDRPVPLGGYGERLGKVSTGVHDPVRARALLISSGDRKLAWVVVDLVGVSRKVRQDLYALVGEELGVRPEGFVVSATHDHSGPGGLARELHWQLAMGPYDPRLYRFVLDRCAEALRAAERDLAPARLGLGVGRLEGRSRNRRIHDGPIDPQLGVLRVDRPDGTPRGVLVNFAAHPTVLGGGNLLVSADWPGACCDALEARLGPGGHAIFTNADEGDQAPSTPGGATDFERMKAQGEAVAAEAWKVLQGTTTTDHALLQCALAELRIPRTLKSTVLLPRTTLVQTVQLQETVLAMVPGEMCVGLGLPLKEKLRAHGAAHAWIIGLSNDHLGYFTTPEMYKTGGYEADMSFCGPTMGRAFERTFERIFHFEEPWGM
ncbi:MAG: neutral/alkaline non-lysosomal ceramidase N-terminal domain-containing protein [Planctomycetes bacterium]|nr:neutral/alkaline non-lysosomal ceramidase N-terminal domain-containing protein [Planctomycetota bacterium]